MDKLKELTNDIHLKIPRLMDDGVGQIYERGGDGFECVSIRTDEVGDTLYYLMDLQDYQTSSYYESEIQTRFQPLGMEPVLNDVLEYLFEVKHFSVDKLSLIKWNLSKPYLKDQPQDFIDYLYDLCQN